MSSSEKKEIYRRFASAGITLAIVLMLVLSGPAGAVKLHIDLDKTEVEQGKPLEFTVTSEIEAGDSYVPIENYSVKISNEEKYFFIDFDQHGKPIGNNSDIISVDPVGNNHDNGYGYGNRYGYDHIYGYGYNFGYGYGYGYGYGHGGKDINYSYNISIDTSTLTEGKYNIEFILNTGNEKKPTFNEKAEFTVKAKSSEEKVIPRRSGGGSGGMPVTHEPKNVAAKEIIRSFAAAKTPVRLAFTGADNIITALAFTPMENAGKVVVKVEMLKGKPAAAKSAPQGEVFQYIDVEISKGVGNNLENAELTFKVPKEWVDGLDPGSSVLMQHYENDEWVNCPTERKAELDDEENYVYSAKANSFSPFAITATKEKAVDIPPLESESPDSENKPGSEVESEPDEEKKGIPGFEILFAVGGLGVSALVRRQRKN